MKRNFFKGAALAAMAFAGFTATAQEEETTTGIELTGSVDAYFRGNLNGPNDEAQVAPSTSFADQSGFALGMVNLIASKQVGKVGFVADLVFGPRGEAAVDGDGSTNIVNQLYLTYAASESVTLTLGNFNTYLGYEVISPTGNFNYSTSYMFSNGPFSHAGLKADFAIDDNWSAMVSVMNPTDQTFSNPAGNYVAGAQVGYSNDSGSAFLNFRYGTETGFNDLLVDSNVFQADLTTGWDLAESFYLGANATYLSGKPVGSEADPFGFYGVALYPQYTISESFSLGLRGEFFGVFDGIDATDDETVIATTVTGSYSVGALTIKPEFRIDALSEEDVLDNDFIDNDGEASKNLASFVIGAIYSF